MRYIKIVVSVVFMVLVILLWATLEKDPHDFTGKCNLCHVGLKNPTILTREPNYLCVNCHKDNVERSHPSDFIPPKKLPKQFPLFNGRMVCITCHFPHRKYKNNLPEGSQTDFIQPGPYLLRADSAGKVFCYTCHQGSFVSEAIDSHAISYKKAHTKPIDYSKKELIDDNSRECLSCHDGTLSTAAGTQVRGLSWEHNKNIGLSHPIGVDYESVYMNKSGEYVSPELLDPRIILVNGKIACETCHNHYSNIKKHLVMDNFKSRLCLACHNL